MLARKTGSVFPTLVLLAAMLSWIGCAQAAPEEFVHVARVSTDLRADLAPDSEVIAKLEWGARLQVLDKRRSAVFVREERGHEGWVQSLAVMSAEVKSKVDLLRSYTESYRPQGNVHVFELTNVHLEPDRESPTLYQLQPNEPAHLLRRQLIERLPLGRAPAAGPSSRRLDDWQLVRLSGGQAGWLLASRAYSGIPDEIGQYAQGRQITSYFRIGSVYDALDQTERPTWLWTQVSRTHLPFDYDVVRVFRWDSQRRSYQTVWIENGLIGFLPVTIHRIGEAPAAAASGFSLIVEVDGSRWRRSYRIQGDQVQLESEGPAPPALPTPVRILGDTDGPKPPASLLDRFLGWWNIPT